MYTGIIERTGVVRAVDRLSSGCRVEVGAEGLAVAPDDSVAVNGVCLTAEAVGDGWFRAFCSAETLAQTSLGELSQGTTVNIETPLAADGSFDGHVVKGTVDTTTQVAGIDQLGEDWEFTFEIPAGYEAYVVTKGAVALDGISLTVAELGEETFTVAVVPQTYEQTTLSEKCVGDPVNFEADILAKYAQRSQRVQA